MEACKAPVPEVDPPLHDRTRRMLSRVLSAAVIRGLRNRFAQQADVLVDILVKRGSFDAIADLAKAYPLTVSPTRWACLRRTGGSCRLTATYSSTPSAHATNISRGC